MKTNPLKAKLRHGRALLRHVALAGQFVRHPGLGPDGLRLADARHRASSDRLVAGGAALRGDQRRRLRSAARVPEGSHAIIKRVLDAGAWGIVVPMVDTVEQARRAIAAAKYPPVGNRSVGGGMHSLNFAASSAEYYRRANDEILVVLQTESPTGVDNAEAIYSLPGVDAIFVGPVDLRANMRRPTAAKRTTRHSRPCSSASWPSARRPARPRGCT